MRKEIVLVGFFEETAELCERCGYSIIGYTDVEKKSDDYDYLGKAKLVVLSYLVNRDMDAGEFLKKGILITKHL